MARVRRILCAVATMLVVTLSMWSGTEAQADGLAFGFYASSCPQAEAIIYRTMYKISRKDPAAPADILRLHFHDSFVRGCDASVLLYGKGTERTAPQNFRLEAFDVVDEIKEELEKRCLGVVSCADILAFAARDGVRIKSGPFWEVRGGRRDGLVSKAAEAAANLPGADMNVDELTANFAKQGMTKAEMVALSGAHTIGDSACVHIDSRIHHYPSTSKTDPILPPDYLQELKGRCPKPGKRLDTVHLDRVTDHKFDTQYYANLVEGKGLLTSDQALYKDLSTRGMVLSNTITSVFFESFTAAMVKMSEISPLTGTAGEIRQYCGAVNTVKKPADKKGNTSKDTKKDKPKDKKVSKKDVDDD